MERKETIKFAPLEGYKHRCPECGKEFFGMADWAYKMGYERSRIYLCSWKCLQKRRKAKEKKKAVVTDA